MKIYVVAHENIVCEKKYRKREIDEELVPFYILNSVPYYHMIKNLPEVSDFESVEEREYARYLVNNWLKKQVENFYKNGHFDLPEVSDIGTVEERKYIASLINNWVDKQVVEFYKTGYRDLGVFDLIIEN